MTVLLRVRIDYHKPSQYMLSKTDSIHEDDSPISPSFEHTSHQLWEALAQLPAVQKAAQLPHRVSRQRWAGFRNALLQAPCSMTSAAWRPLAEKRDPMRKETGLSRSPPRRLREAQLDRRQTWKPTDIGR